MRRALALLAVLLFAGAAFAQPAVLAPCLVAGTDCSSGGGAGTVTTTGTLASGQVALGSGATSVTSSDGLTYTGASTTFKLGIGTDVFLSRASAGTLLVEDGSGAARDVQARTYSGPGSTSTLGFTPNQVTLTGSTYVNMIANGTQAAYFADTGLTLVAGKLITAFANTMDVGESASPWRTGYFGTSVVTPVVQLTLATPTTSGDTCVAGTFWADASFLYVCTSANTIKRAALSAF